MSLAYATAPVKMGKTELAVEANKLRAKRRQSPLLPMEVDRLQALEYEMNNRSMRSRSISR